MCIKLQVHAHKTKVPWSEGAGTVLRVFIRRRRCFKSLVSLCPVFQVVSDWLDVDFPIKIRRPWFDSRLRWTFFSCFTISNLIYFIYIFLTWLSETILLKDATVMFILTCILFESITTMKQQFLHLIALQRTWVMSSLV